PLLVALPPAEAVVHGGRHERHDRQHRRQEGDDVGRPHCAGPVVPGGAERDDQEEAEEDARAREADTDLVEELDELLVLLLAKLLAVHAATIALATVSSRGTRSRQPRASPTGAELHPRERHAEHVA